LAARGVDEFNWAKRVLGVDTPDPEGGEATEVFGKIDELKDHLAIGQF